MTQVCAPLSVTRGNDVIELKALKDQMLNKLTDDERSNLARVADAHSKLLFTLVDAKLSDREAMIAVSHTLIRCAKIIGCSKENLLNDIGGMYDITTLIESKAEGSVQ